MFEEAIIIKIADKVFQKYRELKDENNDKIKIVDTPLTNHTLTELDDISTENKEFDKDIATIKSS